MQMPDDALVQKLAAIDADLEGVEAALDRLEAGTYFSCEVCRSPLADGQLAAQPVVRRCPACTAEA
jgi:DnaK suppressor protein